MDRIEAEIVVESAPSGSAGCLQNVIRVSGPLSPDHLMRLERTAGYCPVGQYFTKRSIVIEDRIERSDDGGHGESLANNSVSLPAEAAGVRALPAGQVRTHYLRDTQEWHDRDGSPVLADEGEVEIYLTCDGLRRPGRWTLLGGHTSEGWNHFPVDLANSGLASSSVDSIRRLVQPARVVADDLQVEVATALASGGRGGVQAAAEQGMRRERRLIRTVKLSGPYLALSDEMIRSALAADTVTRAFLDGDLLLSEKVELTTVGDSAAL